MHATPKHDLSHWVRTTQTARRRRRRSQSVLSKWLIWVWLWRQALGGRAPHVLIGHSLGGKVALEWLQQLAADDQGLGLPEQVLTRV